MRTIVINSLVAMITASAAGPAGYVIGTRSVTTVVQPPAPIHHTVSWYVMHEPEMKARIKACKNDAAIGLGPDCMNANRAEKQIGYEEDVLASPSAPSEIRARAQTDLAKTKAQAQAELATNGQN